MDGGAALRAFFDADWRLRSSGSTARGFWTRARALQTLGFPRAAAADLVLAEKTGLRDIGVLRWFVEHHPDLAKRRASARAALVDDRVGEELREICIEMLLDSGDYLVGHAVRRGAVVRGWLAWRGEAVPTLDVVTDDLDDWRPSISLIEVGECSADLHRGRFSFLADASLSVAIRPAFGGTSCPPLVVYPGEATHPASSEPEIISAALTVIIPVFGDPASLVACLSALREQRAADIAYVLVDDASPDPAVTALADSFARETGGLYLRRPVNGGFASAVNAGLALCSTGDVLILNSDVILPPAALQRLRAAASRAPDVGTLSPLSNDAGCASFPVPLRGCPALPAGEALTIDAVTAEVNKGQVVDVPVPLGSCFYATRRYLDRVGRLSLDYGRGYYEDVDFHLRAGEAGLRRVAACDVYVSHLGGRSFGACRQALIGRNHATLHRRFPGYGTEDRVFDQADSLRRIRSAVEERLAPPVGPAVLIVARARGSQTLVRDRERFWRGQGRWVLVLRWTARERGVGVDCAVADGDGPRSLGFVLDQKGRPRLVSYLSRVGRGRVELLEPERIPSALSALLSGTGRPLHAVVDSLASAAVADVSGQGRGVTIVARDRMAASHLGVPSTHQTLPSSLLPEIGTRSLGATMLGVLLPEACPRAERLTLALARTLRRRRRTTRVVVLGQSSAPQRLMAPGNVWVSGPLGDDDPAEVAAHYAVDRIVSPYRTALFWHVEDVARRSGRPKAYFDWSGGHLRRDSRDLALLPTVDDDAAAASLVDWCTEAPFTQELVPS